jgi:hypothetical protein
MSTNEYFRLALLQYIRMQHNLEALQKSQAEVDSLRAKVSARHKKHRRSDKEIEKNLNVIFYIILSVPTVNESTPRKLP